jgi:DNA-binding transcriptional LysR family regulator
MRLPTSGGVWLWPFIRDGRELRVRTEGRLTLNSLPMILNATLAGLGVTYLPEDLVRSHLASGRLVQVLADWSIIMSGYHLYYPSRHHGPAFAALIEALRYRA